MRIYILLLVLLLILPNSVFASDFIKHDTPVVVAGPGPWDSSRASMPSVVKTDGIYNMLYTGYNGLRFQIGAASSSDGMAWTKNSENPILTYIEEFNRDTHEPTFMRSDSSFSSWHGSSSNGGSSNFTIDRAISADGINWSKNPISPVLAPINDWGSNGVTSPSVIKVGSEYKMWMSSSEGHWSIGYATSPDGINWTMYPNNPVLTDTTTWEGAELGGPEVYHDGTKYHMWYSTNDGFSYSSIAYATSLDGIHWDKPADKNPVLLRGSTGAFDALMVSDPAVLVDDSTVYLWYAGLGHIPNTSTQTGSIGVATASADFLIQPHEKEKVILSPGMMGSWNSDAILHCKTSGYSGSWKLNPLAAYAYQPLIDTLTANGYSVLPFYYDWRSDVRNTADILKSFINTNTAPDEKVTGIAHSLGGLVSRAYIEQEQAINKYSKLLTAGTPHHGVSFAYPAWSAGQIPNEEIVYRVLGTILLRRCGSSFDSNRTLIRTILPSTQNTLPIYDYLKDAKTKLVKEENTMDAQNNWLAPAHFVAPFYGTHVETLSGTGYPTINGFYTRPPSASDIANGNWLDGKVIEPVMTSSGDGAVLTISSSLIGVPNTTISQPHDRLLSSQDGVNAIMTFLDAPSLATANDTSSVAQKSAFVILADTGSLTLANSEGKITTDTDGMIAILNPIADTYELKFTPATTKSTLILAQFYENNKTFWKEYTFTGTTPIHRRFFLHTTKPQENVLRE